MTFEECKAVIDLYMESVTKESDMFFVRKVMDMVDAPVKPYARDHREPDRPTKTYAKGKQYTERTIKCERCGKEFTVSGPGNHHYCPDCKKINADITSTAMELAASSTFDDVSTPTGYPA